LSENIVSTDRIPMDIKIEIDELFPGSEARRRIAYTLMFWDRKPNTKEQTDLSTWAGFKGGSATYKVLRKLKEVGLFTDTVGSVPLSRSLIDLEVEKQQAQLNTPTEPSNPSTSPQVSTAKTLKKLPPIPVRVTEYQEEDEEFPPDPPPVSAQIDMENRVKSAENQIKRLDMTMNAGFEDLKKIIGDMVTPLENAPTSTANTLTVEPPDDVDEVDEIEQEPVDTSTPFSNMSKEEILDMAINSPEMIYTLRNQGVPPTTDTIQAVAHTTRWIALELTTYTQAAYERACEDGYEGSLSDFVNNAVYKYFADRGKVLQWVDTMPRPAAYYPQPNMYPRRPLGD